MFYLIFFFVIFLFGIGFLSLWLGLILFFLDLHCRSFWFTFFFDSSGVYRIRELIIYYMTSIIRSKFFFLFVFNLFLFQFSILYFHVVYFLSERGLLGFVFSRCFRFIFRFLIISSGLDLMIKFCIQVLVDNSSAQPCRCMMRRVSLIQRYLYLYIYYIKLSFIVISWELAIIIYYLFDSIFDIDFGMIFYYQINIFSG